MFLIEGLPMGEEAAGRSFSLTQIVFRAITTLICNTRAFVNSGLRPGARLVADLLRFRIGVEYARVRDRIGGGEKCSQRKWGLACHRNQQHFQQRDSGCARTRAKMRLSSIASGG